MYFFTSQTPPEKINKIIPRVANSSYRLFFQGSWGFLLTGLKNKFN